METTDKKQRGGARQGAGRKKIGEEQRSHTITCRITPKAMAALETMSKAKGLSKNSFINDWLESML
ncbi:MAG: hypothetical protein K2L48_04220 [Mycoplasmoidaceae bacterium]|nr:hypothetical protein [Mycoplasmoidaceae bacterium]